MRAVVQRVASASVAIAGEQTASIGKGLMVLLGVETGDTPKDAAYIAEKLLHLRIFEDGQGVTTCRCWIREAACCWSLSSLWRGMPAMVGGPAI